MSLYDGLAAQPNGTLKGRTLDQRLHASFMLPGFFIEITKKSDKSKFIYPFVDAGGGANYAAVKKYVIGGPDDLVLRPAQQHYPNDTYMMRLAEFYLIYAEANHWQFHLTDATGCCKLQQSSYEGRFAGMVSGRGPSPNGPLTLDVVLNEGSRRIRSMEGMTWYDLVSLHYWNPKRH
jgi:hypothetical protein